MRYDILRGREKVGTLTLGKEREDLQAATGDDLVAAVIDAILHGALTPRDETQTEKGFGETRVPQIWATEKNAIRVQAYFEEHGLRLQPDEGS